MTFRQLKYFSTIYECSSIAKASQKLYISQQGLSRILGALEAEVGVLFDRLHHGLIRRRSARCSMMPVSRYCVK